MFLQIPSQIPLAVRLLSQIVSSFIVLFLYDYEWVEWEHLELSLNETF